MDIFEKIVEEEAKKDDYSIYFDSEVRCPSCNNNLFFRVFYRVQEPPQLYPLVNGFKDNYCFDYRCLLCSKEFPEVFVSRKVAAANRILTLYNIDELENKDYLDAIKELEEYLY